MYKDMIGEKVIVVVSSKAQSLLEYVGVLSADSADSLELKDVDISFAILDFQKGLFGDINTYKEGARNVVINKKYVVSCIKQ